MQLRDWFRRPRFASIARDGWELESAEARHAKFPDSFEIPSLEQREDLKPGDAAKLLFDAEVREDGEIVDRGVSRMWVVVQSRKGRNYIGVLDSDPGYAENLSLGPGSEVLFAPEHVADIDRPPDDYLAERFGHKFPKS